MPNLVTFVQLGYIPQIPHKEKLTAVGKLAWYMKMTSIKDAMVQSTDGTISRSGLVYFNHVKADMDPTQSTMEELV